MRRVIAALLLVCLFPFSIKITGNVYWEMLSYIICLTALVLLIFQSKENPALDARPTLAGDMMMVGGIFLAGYTIHGLGGWLMAGMMAVPAVDMLIAMTTGGKNVDETPLSGKRTSHVLSSLEMILTMAGLLVVALLGKETAGTWQWLLFVAGSIVVMAGICWMMLGMTMIAPKERQLTIMFIPLPIIMARSALVGDIPITQKFLLGILSLIILFVIIIDAYRWKK